MRCSKRLHTSGFTLLEVILALAILAVSLATISGIVRNSFTNSQQASDTLEARIVAQSIIDQMKCGVIAIEESGPMQLNAEEAFGQWQVQILVEPTPIQELLQVRVLVDRSIEPDKPTICELVRWFQSPDFADNLATLESTSNQLLSTP